MFDFIKKHKDCILEAEVVIPWVFVQFGIGHEKIDVEIRIVERDFVWRYANDGSILLV
jgi:hypothetical protein